MPNEDVDYTFDLARVLIDLADIELATRNLVACLFAVAALSGKTPGSALDTLYNTLESDTQWVQDILPSIMGGLSSENP
jgi:hypothetical protein